MPFDNNIMIKLKYCVIHCNNTGSHFTEGEIPFDNSLRQQYYETSEMASGS